jgi:aspartate aminotransferase
MNPESITHKVILDEHESVHVNGRLSTLAKSVIGSEILKIAGDLRALAAEGKKICNLTVGDFSPSEFRPPLLLQSEIKKAIDKGETNYPPSDGVLVLREAIRSFYLRWMNLDYPLESILVHGGSRPGIYGTYRSVVDPGDKVVYPVPSWNNNHYTNLVGGKHQPVCCDASTAFLPTAAQLRNHLRGARLLALNSPLNPTGTAFNRGTLQEIAEMVLEENLRRKGNERPLYILYDQVYWMLTFGKTEHFDPVGLCPELKPYTFHIDGISKAFASTGIRVGWTVGPADIVQRMGNVLAHVGAWAPRSAQTATALLLDNDDAVKQYNKEIKDGVHQRLDALHEGVSALAAEGFPVSAIEPMGAIYLSVRFALNGKTTRDGTRLTTNEDIRRYLLEKAQVGLVPFQAFGSQEENGWFRLSVGAVSLDDIRQMFPRVRAALAGMH